MVSIHRGGIALMAAFIAAAPIVCGAQGNSETYPERPVRLIVPFPPSGGTDLVSRTMLPARNALMVQQTVVDNRGGERGFEGFQNARRTKAVKEYGIPSSE